MADSKISTYQYRIASWVVSTFGKAILDDRIERAFRVLEEACELAQSVGVTSTEAHRIVDYVWSRPAGYVRQEIAGTIVTTLAFAASVGEDAESELAEEVDRIERPEIVEKCRRRQSEKAAALVARKPEVEEKR